MNGMLVEPIEDSLYQAITMNLQIGEDTKRVSLELRYMEKTDLWYMSLYDLQTDEIYLSYVPLLASYGGKYNNLWKPFSYKEIGFLVCYPKSDSPTTENPSKDNLSEFEIVWGDGLG